MLASLVPIKIVFRLFALMFFLFLAAGFTSASEMETIHVPSRTIFAGQSIYPELFRNRIVPVAYLRVNPVVKNSSQMSGKVAKVTLTSGMPVMAHQLEEPNVVEINQPTTMLYKSGGLTISTDVMPLNSAKAGERVRVRNLHSRAIIFGTAVDEGIVIAKAH